MQTEVLCRQQIFGAIHAMYVNANRHIIWSATLLGCRLKWIYVYIYICIRSLRKWCQMTRFIIRLVAQMWRREKTNLLKLSDIYIPKVCVCVWYVVVYMYFIIYDYYVYIVTVIVMTMQDLGVDLVKRQKVTADLSCLISDWASG